MLNFKRHTIIEKVRQTARRSIIREHLVSYLNNETLMEASRQETISKIKNALDNMDLSDDRLNQIYQSISGPMLRQFCIELFASRNMKDSKAEIAADQLYQKLLDSRQPVEDCIQLVRQMQYGAAVNIEGMVDDVLRGQMITMADAKYINAVGPARKVLEKIYRWLWSWEPAMGGRAVGGGEMAMILNHEQGRKGEGSTGGDVVIQGKYKIEMKKAAEGGKSGAGWGNAKKFSDAWRYFSNYLITKGVPEKEVTKELGFGGTLGGTKGSNPAIRFAATMNQASALLNGAGVSDTDINSMWDEICRIIIGINTYKQNSVKNGVTDVNRWMHTWAANAIDAYSNKSKHDVLFFFEPTSLKAMAVSDGNNFLSVMSGTSGPLNYDWDVSWTEMGYQQYVPRFKLEPYRPAPTNINVRDIKERARLLPLVDGIKRWSNSFGRTGPSASQEHVKKLQPLGIRTLKSDQDKLTAIQAIRKFYYTELDRMGNTNIINRDEKADTLFALQKFEGWAERNNLDVLQGYRR